MSIHKTPHSILLVLSCHFWGFTWLNRNTKCHTLGYLSQMWKMFAYLQKLNVFYSSDPRTVCIMVIHGPPFIFCIFTVLNMQSTSVSLACAQCMTKLVKPSTGPTKSLSVALSWHKKVWMLLRALRPLGCALWFHFSFEHCLPHFLDRSFLFSRRFLWYVLLVRFFVPCYAKRSMCFLDTILNWQTERTF